jgi:hypothetical protein
MKTVEPISWRRDPTVVEGEVMYSATIRVVEETDLGVVLNHQALLKVRFDTEIACWKFYVILASNLIATGEAEERGEAGSEAEAALRRALDIRS